jgi:propanol-preferring alcohol dehydrogenase
MCLQSSGQHSLAVLTRSLGVGYVTSKIHPSAVGKGFKEGDAVGFLSIVGCCFECDGCQIHNLSCSSGKQLLQGNTTDGFFAEYAVDYHNVVILPSNLDIKTAAPIFCAGITGKQDFTFRDTTC